MGITFEGPYTSPNDAASAPSFERNIFNIEYVGSGGPFDDHSEKLHWRSHQEIRITATPSAIGIPAENVQDSLQYGVPQFTDFINNRFPQGRELNHHSFNLQETTGFSQSIYNYRAKQYERFLEDLTELEMPNFYLSSNEVYNNEAVLINRAFSGSLSDTIFKGWDAEGRYRYNYRNEDIISHFSDIIIGAQLSTAFFEEYREVFPFISRTQISHDHDRGLFDFLKNISFYEILINDFETEQKEPLTFSISQGGLPSVKAEYECLDIFQWSQNSSMTLDEADRLILTPEPSSHNSPSRNITTPAPSPWQGPMATTWSRNLTSGRLRALSRDKIKKIKQIHDKEHCDYEIVSFKIEKYVGSPQGSPVQTFWLPPGTDVLAYYDSQLRPQQEYTYVIKGQFVVYGTSYRYENFLEDPYYDIDEGVYKASIFTRCEPSFKIIEIPLFEDNIFIAEPPQKVPYVSFHNNENSDNNIDIFLDLSTGEEYKEFVPIELEDQIQIEELKVMNNNTVPSDEYTLIDCDGTECFQFKFTDEPGLFEVYRLNKPPQSYGDFQGYKLGEIRNVVDSSSVMFQDNVDSNKRYYYMFRAINSFGMKSNPTPVYEVELRRDADSSKVDVEVYHFPKQKEYQPVITFQQLLQIVPGIQHTMLDEAQPALIGATSLGGKIGDIYLGTEDSSLWGKNFKIRLRSTTTGRKLDLNLVFNYIKNKTSEDFE